MIQRTIVLLIFLIIYLSGNNIALSLDDDESPDNDNSYVFVVNKDDSEEEDEDSSFNVLNKVDVRSMSFPSCSDTPLQLEECKESVCVDDSPFGKIYNKVKGKNSQGNCEYIQRTPNFGGIDCEFQPLDLANAANLISKFSTSFAERKIALNNAETEQFKTLIQKNCKVIQDIALHEPIQIQKSEDTASSAKFKSTPTNGIILENYTFSKTTPDTTKPAVAESSPQPNELSSITKTSTDTNNLVSVMFTKEVINAIEQVLAGESTDDSSLTTAALSEDKLGFYLNSIIFIDPEKWAIWVNNKRIIRGEKVPDFDIDQVQDDFVTLKYNIKNLDKLAPDWRRKLISITPQSFKSLDDYIQLILDAENHATITVQLKPNQTFGLSSMHIYEGRPQ